MEKTQTHTERFNFGVRDQKGREIGAEIYTYTADVQEGELFAVSAGRWYAANMRATRNEVRYGATQSTRYFATAAERAAAIANYLADAQKRANKKLATEAR